MTHGRQQIREAVVTAITGLDLVGDNVFPSRVDTLTDKHLPCICVYTKEEKSKRITMDGIQERRLTLAIEVVIKSDSQFDNVLDGIIADIETAIFNNQNLKNLTKDIDISETAVTTGNSGELILGIGQMSFNCLYHTYEGTPETII